jgi:hypothetical protein
VYTKCSTATKYAMSAEYYVYGRSRFAHLLTCEWRISPRLRFVTRRCGRYISQTSGNVVFFFSLVEIATKRTRYLPHLIFFVAWFWYGNTSQPMRPYILRVMLFPHIRAGSVYRTFGFAFYGRTNFSCVSISQTVDPPLVQWCLKETFRRIFSYNNNNFVFF